MTRLRTLAVGGAVGTLMLTLATAAPVNAVDDINTEPLRSAVTVGGILEHQRVFQKIANDNGGTRASGTPGYEASADYVAETLQAAGYRVRRQAFTFPFFAEYSDPVLQQTAPTPTDYETGTFEYSGSGDVTGDLVPIDVQLPPPAEPGSTSGCEPADFPDPGADPAVALIQRGTCTFFTKASNAEAAGYDAVIIFNEGQEGRTDLVAGTLGEPVGIPVVGLSFSDGEALAEQDEATPVTMRVVTDTETDLDAQTENVLATWPKGNRKRVVIAGGHLDSVVEGAGINDNGSGTGALLEIAEEYAELDVKPRQRLRFAFWGAEESGLLGSEHYVATRSNKQLRKIKANLNFDMIGSPNYVRFVYDGDGSDTETAGPPGSAQLEDLFTDYYAGQGLESTPSPFNGRSDYGPFIAVGIPAGGLFSGAEGIKTEEQAAVYGGTAGEPYDPCYHEACDDMTNLSTQSLDEMGDAAAHAILTMALTDSGFFPDGSLRAKARHKMGKQEYRGSHLQR